MRALDQIIPALITAGLMAALIHFVKKYEATHTLGEFVTLCLSIMAACLLIAWLLDRRAAARKSRDSDDQRQP